MKKKLLRILDYLNFKFKPDYIEIKFEEDFIYKITLKDNLYNGYKKYCYFNLILIKNKNLKKVNFSYIPEIKDILDTLKNINSFKIDNLIFFNKNKLDITYKNFNIKNFSNDFKKLILNKFFEKLNFKNINIKKKILTYIYRYNNRFFINSFNRYIQQDNIYNFLFGGIIYNKKFFSGRILNKNENFNFDINFNKLNKIIKNFILTKYKKINGRYKVILSPKISATLTHECFGHLFEADNIENFSFKNLLKIGKKICNEKITIIDDPSIKYLFGHFNYDDEGNKSNKKILIKNGYINDFLTNIYYSKKYNNYPGNARNTNYFFDPIIRMSNTYMKNGKISENDLISDVKKGYYLIQHSNIYIEDDTIICYIDLLREIENGKLKDYYCNVIIKINILDLFHKIIEIADNLTFFSSYCEKNNQKGLPIGYGAPSILLDNIMVYSYE